LLDSSRYIQLHLQYACVVNFGFWHLVIMDGATHFRFNLLVHLRENMSTIDMHGIQDFLLWFDEMVLRQQFVRN
jgi:hypothetical protein